MRNFIEIRNSAQAFIRSYMTLLLGTAKFAVGLITFIMINSAFPGIPILSNVAVPFVLAILCIFVDFTTVGVFALVLLVMQLIGISWMAALVTALLGFCMVALSIYFNRSGASMFFLVPLLNSMGIPYVAPAGCGLLGAPLCAGCIFIGSFDAFYLKAIAAYAKVLQDENSTTTAFDVLKDQVVSNSALYIFIIAMVLMNIMVYYVSHLKMNFAKIYGVLLGMAVQFLVQFAGALFFSTGVSIGGVLGGSFISILISLVIIFFTAGTDYTKVEKVRFEDDEYIYYVRAVPKTRIAKANKKITNVTRDTARMDLTQSLGATTHVGRDIDK